MGRWKYFNWLMVLIILGHMYYYFYARYEANALVYVLATVAWVTIAILGYYIYVHRLKRTDGHDRSAVTSTPLPKSPVRERPKVIFKKKN